MITINKLKGVRGCFGKTLIFEVPNVRIDGDVLKWDAFKMYTPIAPTGYIDVPEIEHRLIPDENLLIHFVARATVNNGLEIFEILEGDEIMLKTEGHEGHHFLTGIIYPGDELNGQLDVWSFYHDESILEKGV